MEKIQTTLDHTASEYLQHSGAGTCLRLTSAIDAGLKRAALHFDNQVVMVAIGGYGRRELSRFSDVDLLLIYPEEMGDRVQDLLKEFLHPLWDARLDVKYSAHTLGELQGKIGEDTDFASALVDARIISGKSYPEEKFKQWLTEYFAGGNTEYVEQKLAESQRRRNQHGSTYKLLEPNIKESAGGLRDLHTIHWLAVGKGLCPPGITPEDTIGTALVLQWMVNEAYITTREYASLRESYSFLLQVRHGIHWQNRNSGSKSNYMDINTRHKLASAFGYVTDGEPDVQAFMQAYYRAAREIDYAHNFFLQESLHRDSNSTFTQGSEPLKEFPGLKREGNKIIVDEKKPLQQSASLLVKIFLYAQREQLLLTSEVRQKIERTVQALDESAFQTPEMGQLLNTIFCNPEAGEILRILLYTEILVKIIPEIANIRRLHIQNMFHFYTVDEHTFRAIDHLQGAVFYTSDTAPYAFREVYESLERPELVYWALLLHDFGKAVDSDAHEEVGSELVGTILFRLGLESDVDCVKFLIREHLVMEHHAFRRDVNREETIRSMAEVVRREEALQMLYLLTYADISAVKPDLWSDWKATLLYELYWKTRNYLRQTPIRPSSEEPVTVSPALEDKLFSMRKEMGFRYSALFTEQEIQSHIEAITRVKNPGTDEDVIVKLTQEKGFAKITVITEDRPKLLTSICGVLTAQNLDIIDASIFTRTDNIAIDQFRVIPIGKNGKIVDKTSQKIQQSLKKVFQEKTDTEQLVQEAKRRWRWHVPSSISQPYSIDWTTEDSLIVLEITGPDQVGLLYHLTGILAEFGFDIHSAKIHTENHSITDIFYLSSSTGTIAGQGKLNTLFNTLEKELQTLTE